jgi:hypothetical protein
MVLRALFSRYRAAAVCEKLLATKMRGKLYAE